MLRLEQINKVFNEATPDEKVALDQINLTLEKGDFVTVIGSNGAGKSTLMNMISGVLTPDIGTVKIDNKDVTRLPEYKRSKLIGRVFQDPMAGTAPTMTIEENLAMAYSRNKSRSLRKGVDKKRREFFKESLKSLHLNLENRLNAKVGLLSGGERQALSLLMATFTQPSILLLDEHTAALDPSRAKLITDLTKELVKKDQLTTLMVTHNMQQALDLGNRLIMMDKGQIILEVREEEKKDLTIEQLLKEFQKIRGESIMSDRTLLSID
ncbi:MULTISPECIES: ABC transporter ATP-binding protein [Heyndrickxia]|uniref:ABC transporter ATP-binding protein n=1 Tax=Heyndrickxia TaxID=2837504 RepID=UPI001B169A11|nr:ABC transporter ATP-binding protein [Heyndrickxia oleronia]MCI1591962.1 ABC transporter ATP-binding protein [Heyndrickxia oleronia]MCI1613904.1 ABC transporter ATP-binding protein [Heyndrickxia oleronia]MCI1745139.1 ABC transporter ATP-binding protein [Heyndrickxia oleronia]MCI1760876.1 ABC transporter ATP-binding protein [Heyndrickxia oleronia]GIN41344.1 ABC transporter ATP-binding protein [Heyndrickxia oleronia]